MDVVNKIKHFRYWVQKTLPAVYDDSLSYYELLAKVVQQLNDVIDGHNGLVDVTGQLSDSLAELNKEVNRVSGLIDTFVQTVNQKFDDFSDKLNTEINVRFAVQDSSIESIGRRVSVLEGDMEDFKEQIEKEFGELENTLTDTINQELIVLREYVVNANNEMREYVEERIEQLIHDLPDLQNVYVYDVGTGELVSVQAALYNLYVYLCDGIEAKELDTLGVSASDIDNWLVNYIPKGLKAVDFDARGHRLFFDRYDYLVQSNVTGEFVRQDIYRAEQDNIVKDINALTAAEWTEYTLADIETFVNSTDISTREFEWHNVLISDGEGV